MITIYAKNGTVRCTARKITLSEEFMAVAKMVVDISSPEPIDFAIDDYIDYSYNSRRYVLKDLAKVKKQARRNTYGDAFVYTCTFYEQTWELENCPFLDLVPAQQTAVYSSLPDVVVYAKPQNIVERIQANLDSFYGENAWEVLIPNYITDPTVLELLDTYKDVTLNNATCKGALDEIYRLWGLSWIFVTAYGRKQIYVAFAADISNLFKYGKGQGLRTITIEQKDTSSLATRIYPYGSTENLPARWYNEHPLDDETKYIDEYQYIPNLMLPPSLWHGGTPEGNYVEDADAIAKYGLRPRAIYFEGGEYEKIMPSISGLTAKDIRDAKAEIGDTENVPSTTLYPDATRMDRTLTGDSTTDNGVKPSDSGDSGDTDSFSFDDDSKEITIMNGELGGEMTASDPGEVIYTEKTFFPLTSVELTKIAQYYITFSDGGVAVALDSATTALLAKFSLTPILCAYAPNAYTEVETIAVGEAIAMPANSEGWSADVSLASIFADVDAIYKVYQSQMDNLPFPVKLYLGFIIDYKFATTATIPEIPITINLSSGEGECTRGVTQIPNRFTVKIKQIGFDIMSCKKAANETRQLNMKSGLCAGYSFNILSTKYNASDDSWTLTCYRTTDSDLKIAFPNTDRHIVAEDEFVLTGIEMPDIYVYAAMEKLYEQALAALAELSKPKMVYAPEIDNQKMAVSPQVLHAGMLLQTEDTDLTIPALLPVDSLQITEDGEKLRQFSVTLRNEKADNLLRQIVSIAHTEQGVSQRQVSTAINQAINTFSSEQESAESSSGGTASISFLSQGSGNAVSDITESTPGIYVAKKEKTFVDLDSEQTITGKKYISKLLVSALLGVPTSAPASGDIEANKSFLWCDTNGNYTEAPTGGGVANIYDLTIRRGSVSAGTYNLGEQAADINLSSLFSGYATESWVSSNFNNYTLPTASSSTKGGIKVGSTLTISSEVLNVVVGSVTQSNTGFVTGGDVYSAIAAAVTSALHYRGISSTALTDGGTETATIGGVALTPQSGDVVIYGGFEFLWENNVWNKLGDDTSYALKTITVTGDGTYITGGGDLTTARTLTLGSGVITSLGKADTAYQKPSGGIPDSDLADAYLKLSGNSVATKITGDVYMTRGKYLKMVESNGTDSVNLLGISSSGAWFTLGNSSYRAEISSNNSNILHIKSGVSYAVYDESNLTKSVLTTLLESSNGYYVKKAGDTMTGDLTFDASSDAKNIKFNFGSSGSGSVVQMSSSGRLYFGADQLTNNNATYLYGGSVYLSWYRTALSGGNAVIAGSGNNFAPSKNNSIYLGHGSYRWATVYGVNFDASGTLSVTGVSTLSGGAKVSTMLAIPQSAPSTSASWYSANDSYLWCDTSGNYTETPSGGGGGGGETLTITKNSQSWLSYNGSTAVSLNLVVPTALSDLTDDSTHRLVTDTQIAAWNAKYDKPSGGIPGTDLATAYLPLAGNAVASKITGNVILGNNVFLQGVHTNGTAARELIGLDNNNIVTVGCSTNQLRLLTSSVDIKHNKNGTLYSVYDESNLSLATLAGSSAIGSTSKPVYYNGSSLVACGTSLTDYLPLSGGTITSTGVKPLILNSTHSSSQSSLRLSVSGTEKAIFGYQESYNVGAYLQNLAVTNYPYVNIASDGKFKYNNSWVFWHEGNDGASSGLDADLLDGNHGSYYDSLYAFYDSGSTSALGVQYPLSLLKTSTPNASYWWYIRSMYYSSPSQCFQEAFTYNQTTPDMYIRQTYGGTTTNWYKVYHTGNLAKSDLTALLDASTGTYVPKKDSTNFYPYIGTAKGSKWYKVTFPHNGQAAGANRWFMLGMDLVISSVYYTSPIRGVVHLMYYFSYSNSTSTYTAGNVKGMFTGVNYTGVQVKYDASNPAIFYVRTVNDSTASTTLSIENLMAMDSAVNWDYLNTTIEAIAEASIPSSASTVVPIDSYLPLTAGSSYPLTGVLYSDLTSSNTASFAMKVNGTERASIGFSSGYMSLVSNGEELCVSGGDDQRIYVNYRKAHDGYAPVAWYLMAGTNTSYASLYAGVVRPGLDNSYTLGGPSNRWSAIYGMTGHLYGNLFFDATSANRGISWTNSSNVTASALAMNSNGALVLGANQITNSKDTYVYGTHIYLTWGSSRQLQFTDNTVVPNSTKVISLGTDSLRYRYIYGQAIEADTFNGLFYTSSENATAFTHRATPSTAVGDSGVVKKIHGNTIVWNQHETNATFADGTTGYSAYSSTISASDGKLSVNVTSAYGGFITPSFALISGHKYLLRMVVNCPASTGLLIYHRGNSFIPGTTLAAGLNVFTGTATAPNSATGSLIIRFSVVQTYTVTSVLFFDLTQMGLESIDTDKFNSLFPLNYYAYNTGEVVSLTAAKKVKLNNQAASYDSSDWALLSSTYCAKTTNAATQAIILTSKSNSSAAKGVKLNNFSFVVGHKYYIRAELDPTTHIGFYSSSNAVIFNTDVSRKGVVGEVTNSTSYFGLRLSNSAANNTSYTFRNIMCVDLTLMYGAGFEPTAREFEHDFPQEYIPYNATGVDATIQGGLQTGGFNIWDEEWEGGSLGTDGNPATSSTQIRSKNYMAVDGGATYYAKSPSGIQIFEYDSGKNYLDRNFITNATITLKANTRYIKFRTGDGITSYANNICINLSDTSRNGTYEPHWESTLPLPITQITSGGKRIFPNGLMSAGSVYDELTSTKAVKRMGIVDLGTLNWTYDSGQRFAVQKPDAAHSLTGSPCMCARYVGYTGVWSGFSDKQVVVGHNTYSGSSYIVIKDSAYTDAAVFKTAMNGVYLVYELATPVEYTLDSPIPLFFKSDKLGTQTLIPENTAVVSTAPMKADFQYGSNLGDAAGANEGYLPLAGGRVTGELNMSAGEFAVPTNAPRNPDASKTYLWCDTSGSYTVVL